MATQTNTNSLGKTRDFSKFLKGVKSELKKVNWPNKKELTSYTGIVFLACGVAALGIWFVDTAFGQILKWIIK